jgi:hypothetical protein
MMPYAQNAAPSRLAAGRLHISKKSIGKDVYPVAREGSFVSNNESISKIGSFDDALPILTRGS